jgi:hypothetical protein
MQRFHLAWLLLVVCLATPFWQEFTPFFYPLSEVIEIADLLALHRLDAREEWVTLAANFA